MITVKVVHRSSRHPAQHYRVSIVFEAMLRGMPSYQLTDANGEAHFDSQPGAGKIWVDGTERYRGHLSGTVVITI